MIAGHKRDAFFNEMRYNATQEQLRDIASMKKTLLSGAREASSKEERALLNWVGSNLTENILPAAYNESLGYESQSDWYQYDTGSMGKQRIEISEIVSEIGQKARMNGGDLFDGIIQQIKSKYSHLEYKESTEKEQEQMMESIPRNTCAEEDDSEHGDIEVEDIEDMAGSQQLIDWLKKMQSQTSSIKKMKQIEKMSDLQKVSPTELARPRALLMKKIMNRELYCRKKTEGERTLHMICDASGSMLDYVGERNSAALMTLKACEKAGVRLISSFWNVNIYKNGRLGPQDIRSEEELRNKFLKIRPDGEDRMGYCVLQKLKSLTRKSEKQYILCMSDGTGSFDSSEQSLEVLRLAKEKNVEVRYVLFSRENSVYETPEEDIFYIYD